MNSNQDITTLQITKSLASEEWELVRVNIRYPQCGNEKIDGYISEMAEAFLSFAQKKLLPKALKENADPYSLVVVYKVTMCKGRYFSFYFDLFVSQSGNKGEVKRIPLNFDTERSTVVFPLEKVKKRTLMPLILKSAEELSVTMPLYSDFEKRVKKYFKKSHAFIMPEGICITYDSGTLMPHEKGAVSLFVLKTDEINQKD